MHDFTSDPIGAIEIARRNRLTTALGATPGIIPIGAFYMGHCQIASWSPIEDWHSLIVYAALIFSISTMWAWGTALYEHRGKALCFTVVLEGLMMSVDTAWLSIPALILLVGINATYCGCRLAVRADATRQAREAAAREAAAREAPPTPTTAKVTRSRTRRATPRKLAIVP